MRTRQGQVLYDIRSDRPAIGNEVRGGLAGVLIGVLLLVAVWKRPEAAPRRFVLAFILAWAGWSLWNGLRVVRSHEAALEALNRGRARVAEGVVTDFVRERADGRGATTFKVGETSFVVREGDTSVPGLHRFGPPGGPVRSGARLRVTYLDRSILRVEEP